MKEKNKRQSFVTRPETEADRISYHPPIQLDCKMCKSLVAENIFSNKVNCIIKLFRGMMLPEEENKLTPSISYSPAY